jgi:hypothetical protein
MVIDEDLYSQYRHEIEKFSIEEIISYSKKFEKETNNYFYTESASTFNLKFLKNIYDNYQENLTTYLRANSNRIYCDPLKVLYAMSDSIMHIKLVHNPLFALSKYELWENGYIEISAHNNLDYIIRMRVKMKYLKPILEEYIKYKKKEISYIL